MLDRTITLTETDRRIALAISKINTNFVGKIVSCNYVTNKYSVQPLLKYKLANGKSIDRAVIFECPISFPKTKMYYMRIPYSEDDLVYVGCNRESVDEAILNSDTRENRMDGIREFREMDGVILGGITSDVEEPLDQNYKEDFIIQNRVNKDLIVIKKDGGIILNTATTFNVTAKDMNITGNLSVGGNVGIDGAMNSKGEMSTNSSITSSGSCTSDGGFKTKSSITATGDITSQAKVSGKVIQETTTGKTL